MNTLDQESKREYLRNFVFGVEDSLVSTVGLLSGVAIAGVESATIILTGVILIFVEALSMGAGSFLAESSTEEFSRHHHKHNQLAVVGGGIMFLSYFLAGFIPLAPYFLFAPFQALVFSILLSMISLFGLGLLSARISHIKSSRVALRMLVVGGLAIVVGTVVGLFF